MTKKLFKSDTDKVFAGVIGGLGEYFEIDSVLLRLAYLLITILTGIFPAIVAYIIAAVIVPKKPPFKEASYTEQTKKDPEQTTTEQETEKSENKE